MKITVTPTSLPEVQLVVSKVFGDARGFFTETYHQQEFAQAGLPTDFVQDNHSRSGARVVRGLHYQDRRAPMGKLVRCTYGAIFDVAVDIRAGSPTFGQWVSVELSAENKHQLYLPPGFAHGFAVLGEAAEVQYKCTGFYAPEAEGTIAWDDPGVGIAWPYSNPVLSAKDEKGMSLAVYRGDPGFYYAGG